METIVNGTGAVREPSLKAALASGEFDRRRAAGIQSPGIVVMERLFKLRPQQLKYYRANYLSRKRRKL
jgi:hypothetical protein